MRSQSTRVPRVCLQCGTTFLALPYEAAHGKAIFCSRTCKGRHKSEHTPPKPPNRTCEHCGKQFYVRPYIIRLSKGRFCSGSCRAKHRTGNSHPNWKGGRTTLHGYVILHTASRTHEREHRVVMEALLGRALEPGEVVHHIDGDRANNDPGNLAVMSASAHSKLHHGNSPKRWSLGYDRCLSCGTTTVRHNAKGLCVTCYGRHWREASPAAPT